MSTPTYTQAQLDTAVQEAVKETEARYRWITENAGYFSKRGDAGWRFIPAKNEAIRFYPDLDALVSAEMAKEKGDSPLRNETVG